MENKKVTPVVLVRVSPGNRTQDKKSNQIDWETGLVDDISINKGVSGEWGRDYDRDVEAENKVWGRSIGERNQRRKFGGSVKGT